MLDYTILYYSIVYHIIHHIILYYIVLYDIISYHIAGQVFDKTRERRGSEGGAMLKVRRDPRRIV